jgi:hypothetical protein
MNANVILPDPLLRLYESLLVPISEPLLVSVRMRMVLLFFFSNRLTQKDHFLVIQKRADTFLSMVLFALPFGGAILQERKPHDLNRLLEQMETYVRNRKTTNLSALSLYVDRDGFGETQRDVRTDSHRVPH